MTHSPLDDITPPVDVTPTAAADHDAFRGVIERLWRRQSRRANIVTTLCCFAIMLGLGVVFARVCQLQLDTPERLRPYVVEPTSRMTIEAPRGDIRDRRGRVLAASTTGYRLFIDPHLLLGLDALPPDAPVDAIHVLLEEKMPELASLAADLASVTGRDEVAIAARLGDAAQRAVLRALDGNELRYVRMSEVLKDGPLARAQVLTREHVHLERTPVRVAPLGDGVAQVVGFVGAEGKGLIGAERAYDIALRPQPGHVDYVRDARGRAMWVHAGDYAMPKRGDDLRLSIDLRLQHIAMQELERGVSDADAAGGRLVLIDPASGEVLAMADVMRTPDDAEPFSTERADAALQDGRRIRFDVSTKNPLREVHPAFGRNRLLGDVYEPGSTFKPFMWAATLAHGETRPDEGFDTHDGAWRTPYGRLIEDVHEAERLTWREVLVYSSNIGMAQGVARLTHDEARDAVLRFGFGARTNLRFPGESRGIVTSARNWNKYTQTSVAFGYEVAVTPMQMVRAFAVFARSGMLAGTLPDLTLEATTHDSASHRVIRRVLEPHIALETRDALVRVAERMLGFMRGNHPDDPTMPYTMFGKSGTAQIARPDGKGHLERQYHSSFVAAAPASEPRLVVLVVIDDPGPELVATRRAFGSQVAGPVTARVLRRSLEYLGVPHDVVDTGPAAERHARR
jgi:cell division protein FtsI/penicillin-binding protein 2